MKDKILNALKSKTFFALAINIVIMALKKYKTVEIQKNVLQ